MLLSDLPFIDDVKKGERYLERERYFVMTLCYFCYVLDLFCWTPFIFVDMYLLWYVFMSCMRLISLSMI